eukprot:3071197-Rhodomonas_salina.3
MTVIGAPSPCSPAPPSPRDEVSESFTAMHDVRIGHYMPRPYHDSGVHLTVDDCTIIGNCSLPPSIVPSLPPVLDPADILRDSWTLELEEGGEEGRGHEGDAPSTRKSQFTSEERTREGTEGEEKQEVEPRSCRN